MTRDSTPYGEQHVRPVHVAGAVDVETPVAGYYRLRLSGGSVRGGVKLFFGPPNDPITGEELDRGWRWQAFFNDEPIDFNRVWPNCAGDPISEADYRRMCRRVAWAQEHAPDSAYAQTGRKFDHLSAASPLPF